MLQLQKALLIAASIAFIAVIGAAVYEHLSVVPVWKKAPPRSLSMFSGPYAITPDRFWKLIHPICLLLTIGALIACWRTESRTAISVTLGGYVLILAVTGIYFVPELLRIIQTPYADTVSADLTRRAGLWEMWSLIRLGVLIVLAVVLLNGFFRLPVPAGSSQTGSLPGLSKPATAGARQAHGLSTGV